MRLSWMRHLYSICPIPRNRAVVTLLSSLATYAPELLLSQNPSDNVYRFAAEFAFATPPDGEQR